MNRRLGESLQRVVLREHSELPVMGWEDGMPLQATLTESREGARLNHDSHLIRPDLRRIHEEFQA